MQENNPFTPVKADTYRNAHFERIINATMDLWKQPTSQCEKCHHVEGSLNCLFCYCPLYHEKDCGGNYTITPKGIKDCSNCTFPHEEGVIKMFLKKMYDE